MEKSRQASSTGEALKKGEHTAMITTQNMMPITASKTAMKPRSSIQTNQAETSKDLEERLLAATQPFTYEGGAATLPVPSHPDFTSDGSGSELRDRPVEIG